MQRDDVERSNRTNERTSEFQPVAHRLSGTEQFELNLTIVSPSPTFSPSEPVSILGCTSLAIKIEQSLYRLVGQNSRSSGTFWRPLGKSALQKPLYSPDEGYGIIREAATAESLNPMTHCSKTTICESLAFFFLLRHARVFMDRCQESLAARRCWCFARENRLKRQHLAVKNVRFVFVLPDSRSIQIDSSE
jgi:hypothetical protein